MGKANENGRRWIYSQANAQFGWITAEVQRTRSKNFFIKKSSELCELHASVVK